MKFKDMKSVCCGVDFLEDTDVCRKCHEHSEGYEERDEDDKFCEAVYPGTALVCSLVARHEGDHQALGSGGVLKEWENVFDLIPKIKPHKTEWKLLKLKTLKDIELPSDGCDCENRIKQESIKWVKSFLEKIKPIKLKSIENKAEGVYINWEGSPKKEDLSYIGSITTLVDFNNLIEEDLQ